MKKFSSILDWAGNSKYNAFYLIINVLVFSDVFLMRNLEKWREKNGERLEKWLEVMHEIDALNSIANLSFENQDWDYPVILKENEIPVLNSFIKLIEKIEFLIIEQVGGFETLILTLYNENSIFESKLSQEFNKVLDNLIFIKNNLIFNTTN